MAFGVIRYYTEQGISIPKEISIIGFDDIDLARHIHPPLTTVKVFKEEMGQQAVQILLDASASKKQKSPATIRIPTELIIRASAGPPSKG
jgi:DNA-binding LacI/PurR family transcriptional regulator